MASEKITEEELVTRIRGEISDSLGYMGDVISTQREQAMKYYYGLPFGGGSRRPRGEHGCPGVEVALLGRIRRG